MLWACDLAAHGARHGSALLPPTSAPYAFNPCRWNLAVACQQPHRLSRIASRAVPKIEVGTFFARSTGAEAMLRRLILYSTVVVSPALIIITVWLISLIDSTSSPESTHHRPSRRVFLVASASAQSEPMSILVAGDSTFFCSAVSESAITYGLSDHPSRQSSSSSCPCTLRQ